MKLWQPSMGPKCSRSLKLVTHEFWELRYQAKQLRLRKPRLKASTGNRIRTKPSHKRNVNLEIAITLQSEQNLTFRKTRTRTHWEFLAKQFYRWHSNRRRSVQDKLIETHDWWEPSLLGKDTSKREKQMWTIDFTTEDIICGLNLAK